MAQDEAMRTIAAKNEINAQIGDTVRFLLPGGYDILSSMREGILPIIATTFVGILVGTVMKMASTWVFAAMLLTFIISKIVFNNMGRNSAKIGKFEVKILEVVNNQSINSCSIV